MKIILYSLTKSFSRFAFFKYAEIDRIYIEGNN